MKEFGNRLKSRAAELNLTAAEVARRAGLTSNRYSNYVSGIREPDLATLVRIANVLETSSDDLLGIAPPARKSDRTLRIERLVTAAKQMSMAELEVIVLSAEAVATKK